MHICAVVVGNFNHTVSSSESVQINIFVVLLKRNVLPASDKCSILVDFAGDKL